MIAHLINHIKQDKFIPSVIKDHFGGYPNVGINILHGNTTDKHDQLPGYMIYNRKEYPTEWNHVLVDYENIYVYIKDNKVKIQTGVIYTHEHLSNECDCMYYDNDYYERSGGNADYVFGYSEYFDRYEFDISIIDTN